MVTSDLYMERKNQLFTIELSSSYEEDEEEVAPPPPRKQSPQAPRIISHPPPTKVTVRQVSIPTRVFLETDSSEEDEDEYQIIEQKRPIKKSNNSKKPQLESESTSYAPSQQSLDDEYDAFVLKDSDPAFSPPKESVRQQPVLYHATSIIPSKKILHTDSPIYAVSRESKIHLTGRTLIFRFSENGKQMYKAVLKSKGVTMFPIYMKDTEEQSYCMLIGNNTATFSLHEKTEYGDELISINFKPQETSADTHRKIAVTIFKPLESSPSRLISKAPGLDPDGKPFFDFEGRFSIESIKNAILVENQGGPSLVMIRKAGEDMIEIEVRFPHDPIIIFALGISSFLAKVK